MSDPTKIGQGKPGPGRPRLEPDLEGVAEMAEDIKKGARWQDAAAAKWGICADTAAKWKSRGIKDSKKRRKLAKQGEIVDESVYERFAYEVALAVPAARCDAQKELFKQKPDVWLARYEGLHGVKLGEDDGQKRRRFLEVTELSDQELMERALAIGGEGSKNA